MLEKTTTFLVLFDIKTIMTMRYVYFLFVSLINIILNLCI